MIQLKRLRNEKIERRGKYKVSLKHIFFKKNIDIIIYNINCQMTSCLHDFIKTNILLNI
jgi:hypothetical protein